MPSNKAHVRQFTQLVQAESKTISRWLGQTAKDRQHRSLEDRLEALLWSWPIRPALSKNSPRPLWNKKKDEELVRRLTALAETVYPDTWYPEPVYSMEWGSLDSPMEIHDKKFKAVCHDLCKKLRSLSGLVVPDPHNDVRWLCLLFEHGWGDGQYEYRHDEQRRVVRQLNERTRQQVCEIGELARDAAYHQVRITRALDAERQAKSQAESFKNWVHDARTHAPFVEAHFPHRCGPHATSLKAALVAFTAAFRVVEAKRNRVTQYVSRYMKTVFEDQGRDRRSRAGRPERGPWVKPANEALKSLKIPPQDRRILLMSWGLVPLEHNLS